MSHLIWIARRLCVAVATVLVVATINFLLLQLPEGDAVDVLASESGGASPEYIETMKERFGLNEPLHIRLALYLSRVAVLDFGYSFRYAADVTDLVFSRLWPTLVLMSSALVLSVIVGVVMGIWAGIKVNRLPDTIISLMVVIGAAMPAFWLGLMLVVLFSINLGWFPSSGMETVAAFYTGFDRFIDIAHHMVLPVATLSVYYIALYARLMRASYLEQAGMDFAVTAIAKGLPSSRVVAHIARNAVLPIITMVGVQLGAMFGGSVVIEAVFGWPGLGSLIYEAIHARELNVVMGVFLISSMLVIVANVVVDLAYSFVDPRIEGAR
uniref:ABC transporter permease n=1 Tax=Ensifer adhaerens TaxID=106592 RepID=UPI003F49A38F